MKATNIKSYNAIWRLIRDIMLFHAGLIGVGYETIWATTVNQTLIILFGAMLGIPAFLRVDEFDKTIPKEEEK